jgi:integrase
MRDYRFLKMPKIAKQKSRKRPLTIAELRRITPVRLPRDGDRIVRMVLVAAVTGLRRDILLNLEESWIDRRNALLCVPGQAMKGGEDRWGDEDFEVPLCKWALELIPKPPSRLAKFCFANPKNGQPNKQIDRSLWKIAAAMDGCKKSEGACAAARHEHRWFCLQELRMTFLTLLDKAGVEFAVREYLVGHAPTGVSEESYIRRHIEVLRAAVAKMDDLRGEIEASTGGNVVRFTG